MKPIYALSLSSLLLLPGMSNPYKVHLTPVQRAAVDAGRARLLAQLRQLPFSRGQRAGEFAVHFGNEWVEAAGTLDQFIVEHADAPLDDSWHAQLPTTCSIRHEGRGAYVLWVPHSVYLAAAARARYGLPCQPTWHCVCTSAWELAVALALAAAALYLMPASAAADH